MSASSKSTKILKEAEKIVFGRGEENYGHPRDNFQDEADAWTAYLRARKLLARDASLEPRDIAQLNVLQKVIRDGNKPAHDNLLDQIGYTLTAERIAVE